jgi:hypothetical protein
MGRPRWRHDSIGETTFSVYSSCVAFGSLCRRNYVAHAETQPELRFLNGALTKRSKHGRFDANRVILLCFVEQPKDSGWRFLGNVRDKMAVWVYRMYLDGLSSRFMGCHTFDPSRGMPDLTRPNRVAVPEAPRYWQSPTKRSMI